MIKSRTLKPALLMALIVVIVIALAEPIAGVAMGQGNLTDQRSMVIVCPDNQTRTIMQSEGDHQANETVMHCMGHPCMMGHRCMMGNLSANKTMMHCMMGNQSMNETMMHCMHCMHSMMGNNSMMGNHSMNETMMHCMHHCMMGHHGMMGNDSMMGDHSANETMMSCMMVDHMMKMDQNASTAQARLDCAQFWLKQAIELHKIHLKNPSTATNESQLKMMYRMMRAYECIVGEDASKNMTMGMMNTTASHESERY